MRSRRWASITLLVAVASFSWPAAAGAHTATATNWPTGWQERNIRFFFSGANWTLIGNIAQRMRESAHPWGIVPNTGGFRFVDSGSLVLSTNPCSNPLNTNGLFWTAVDGAGNDAARTYTCATAGRITAFTLIMDGQESIWHTGSNQPTAGTLDI